MRINIFILLCCVFLFSFVYYAVPSSAELVSAPVLVDRVSALSEFQIVSDKSKNETTYTIEELILLELKSINEKLANIQRNTFVR